MTTFPKIVILVFPQQPQSLQNWVGEKVKKIGVILPRDLSWYIAYVLTAACHKDSGHYICFPFAMLSLTHPVKIRCSQGSQVHTVRCIWRTVRRSPPNNFSSVSISPGFAWENIPKLERWWKIDSDSARSHILAMEGVACPQHFLVTHFGPQFCVADYQSLKSRDSQQRNIYNILILGIAGLTLSDLISTLCIIYIFINIIIGIKCYK